MSAATAARGTVATRAAQARPRIAILPTPEAVNREWARRNLGRFSRYMDPGYQPAPHLTALDAALTRVHAGDCKRLMVFMPPRGGKSRKVSQMFPCWHLGRRPTSDVVLASYAESLALEHSRKARDLFASQQMRNVFPDVRHAPHTEGQARVMVERQAAHEWGTKQGGRYYAVGVGGGLTGRGFDIGIVDDPYKDRQEADSATVRKRVLDWYQSTFYTRQAPGASIILALARWRPDDLAGHLISEMAKGGDKWEILHVPAIDEETGLSYWPERWPLQSLRQIQIAVGSREWGALYQGTPQPEGGAIFKQSWFTPDRRFAPIMDAQNDTVGVYQSWDTAEDEGEANAFSSCATGELTPGYKLRMTEVWRGKMGFTDLCNEIIRKAQHANRFGKLRAVVIEKKSTGVAAINHLQSTGPAWLRPLIFPNTPHGSKVQRANAAAPWCDIGCVLLPHPCPASAWLHDFEAEFFSFPGSANKDQVDCVTQLIWYLHHYLAEGAGVNLNLE